jgi:carotenoid cleavage dioxygenase-like enzyme
MMENSMLDKKSDTKTKIPRSLMKLKRTEFISKIKLNLKEGKVPSDLQGHVFFIAPVGFGNTPYGDGTPIFNGDGMVYRLDFDKPGEVWLKSRIAKTPCYFADEATQTDKQYEIYKFQNFGLGRFSLLGLRNQVNTGLLPIKSLGETTERLLITYDAGRPYEIDTDSLEAITPVGKNKEWQSEIPLGLLPRLRLSFPLPRFSLSFPFRPVLTTAHPGFDKQTGEMFTVNYVRSLVDFLESAPITIPMVDRLLEDLKEAPKLIADFLEQGVRRLTGQNLLGNQNFIEQALKFSQLLLSHTYLIRWDREGAFERWKLVLPDGAPVTIKQSVHQMGITEDYVILADTGFKFELEQLLDNSFPVLERIESLRRYLTTQAQSPDTALYIVHRQDLRSGKSSTSSEAEIEVVAQKVVIPLELVHFLVNYENPAGNITLHGCHNAASDVAEWIHDSDVTVDQTKIPPHLRGLVGSQMDVNRLGRYVINGSKGRVVESKVIYDTEKTWGVGLSAYDERSHRAPIKNIFLQSFGFRPELITDFIANAYKDYKYRAIPIEQLKKIKDGDIPPCLFRLNTESMSIEDCYKFSVDQVISSPQFVPSSHSTRKMDGYLICTVISDQGDEIWIFNAAKLSKGPICKLNHPSLDLGYTLHTTWLPSIEPRTADYYVSVRDDYAIKKEDKLTKKLFEEAVYPNFEHT